VSARPVVVVAGATPEEPPPEMDAAEAIACDAAMEDRVAPRVGGQRHRNGIGGGAIGRGPDLALAPGRLTQPLNVAVGFGATAFRVVVNQPSDFVDEAPAIRRRIDAEQSRQRRRSPRHGYVFECRGRRGSGVEFDVQVLKVVLHVERL